LDIAMTDAENQSEPHTLQLLVRGAGKRCPRCGQGKLFRRWTDMRDDCPRCGLVFEQEEGYWVGALTINTVVTLALFGVTMLIAVYLTWPDTPTLPLTLIGIAAALVFPIFFYPFSKTLWVAADLAFFNRSRLTAGTGLKKQR
jgi:uncharacterized protein (DUF983 family)